MEGLKLLVTFIGLAAIAVTVASFVGILVDQLPHVHDMFSILVFFGLTIVLLVVAWPVAVKITAPKHAAE